MGRSASRKMAGQMAPARTVHLRAHDPAGRPEESNTHAHPHSFPTAVQLGRVSFIRRMVSGRTVRPAATG